MSCTGILATLLALLTGCCTSRFLLRINLSICFISVFVLHFIDIAHILRLALLKIGNANKKQYIKKNLNVVVVNSMIIFLGRIPANTRKHEVTDFIEPALKGGFFQKSGRIEHIKILVLKDKNTNTLEYHGLVTIDPDDAAKRVIKKLNRKVFKGKHIAVREYQLRAWHNDPRINMREYNEELMNKRKGDRRRSRIEEDEDISDKFSSNEVFHRNL